MAEPEPEVTWLRNGKELGGSRYEIEFSKTLASLTVINCNEEDGGQYECQIENQLGSCKSAATLTIEGTVPNVVH